MIFLRGKGIVISKKDIEEADRYITIFMEDYGKVSTVIKGIRKSKKRDKTAVDILSLTDFQFYKKNDSLIISNFSTIKDYIGIKSDIDKINIVFYIFSILNQILVENGRNRKIYEVLEKTLNYLDLSNDERKNYLLILYFLYIIIKEEGISIENNNDMEELQVEVQTQRKVEIDDNVKKILEYLFKDNLKVVINDEKYKIDYIKKAILVLENYINFNLDININAKKILWGALLW
ncbi:DNA repair protein RecO [Fusobacterium animalis D11]|uniref:DNA repair protein RecO n=1 Tax=Fusobacterium animalis D11 TaxID=556264 RepID=D6BFP7_9FUSO|nr:DNA repair protein RecO [Fusobacterium nucleatum]EFD80994.1 DNA repair protein RecO [Fusobacterium animalis D11]